MWSPEPPIRQFGNSATRLSLRWEEGVAEHLTRRLSDPTGVDPVAPVRAAKGSSITRTKAMALIYRVPGTRLLRLSAPASWNSRTNRDDGTFAGRICLCLGAQPRLGPKGPPQAVRCFGALLPLGLSSDL